MVLGFLFQYIGKTLFWPCSGPLRDYGQSVINFHISLIGNSLKCYKGELEITKDTTQKEKDKEPELVDCNEADHVCVSQYIRTDVIFDSGTGETMLAGGWSKSCIEKSEINQTGVI